MLNADLHVHTWHSVDSYMSYDQLIKACQKENINCIAVADHGTTQGARDLLNIAPFKVIVCQEIMTPYGEIMGMFLKEDILNKVSLEEAIRLIHDQEGLVCIPHPFDRVRPSAFRNLKKLESIMDCVDIIEIFNSRSLYPGIGNKSIKLAQRFHKVMSAGTDAHSPAEIGCVRIEMEDFNTSTEFLTSLSKAKIQGRKSSVLIHLISTTARLRKQSNRKA